VDILLPECQCLHPGPQFAAPSKPWRRSLAIPADARLFALEILKFLGTLALIMATALILLMAG
jgi:hypothetical protein